MTREQANELFVRRLQGELGLLVDGWAGPATRAAWEKVRSRAATASRVDPPARLPHWRRIVIHHSAGHDNPGLDTAAIAEYHTAAPPAGRGWSAIGYHWLVEQVHASFVAIAGRPMYRAGAHAPPWNREALGVCLVGNFELGYPPRGQLVVAEQLCAGLCYSQGIPPSEIWRHDQVPGGTSTACPGKLLDIELFRQHVAKRLEGAA